MKKLSVDLIQELSTELGIAPAFIEKDYYVVELLKILNEFQTDKFNVFFSGGTSLSKGYGLINRFSEDIDFMVSSQDDERNIYRNFRKKLWERIDSTGILKVDSENKTIRNESRFFSFYVDYPKLFKEDYLRQQVKIEISAKTTRLNPELRKINSWIDKFLKEEDFLEINCLTPFETAANKFSAFLWRADCKDRTSDDKKFNDPTIIRHLYDLYKLKEVIKNNKSDFYELIFRIYEDDKKRGNKNNSLSLKDFSNMAMKKIESDGLYEQEYNNFVTNMIYKPSDIVLYVDALNFFKELICNI